MNIREQIKWVQFSKGTAKQGVVAGHNQLEDWENGGGAAETGGLWSD
ncbi:MULTISPECIES: hypothetical protein [unclassified Siphonobacter]|nr:MULTISPECIES: hypothetical protein [unclassified Siphonobacter]